jgi:alpha-beta hydrolase superfamily lysophospholipase
MLLAYSVMPYMERLVATPTLMVVAEGDDHTHWDLAAKAYDAIPGERKRMHVVSKSTHLTLYEDEDAVATVAAVASAWFSEYL